MGVQSPSTLPRLSDGSNYLVYHQDYLGSNMDWKKHARSGMKAAGAMGGLNLLVLGVMMVVGYDTTPASRFGGEIPIPVFAIATIIGGGIVPGLMGTVAWTKIEERWSEQSRIIFTLLALTMATFMTLPITGRNLPTGDAYVLTTVLHYSTAILGSLMIPYYSNAEKATDVRPHRL